MAKVEMPTVVRTSAGLRDALFDELDRMRKGETNASNANAVARLADQICNTVHMELEVHRHLAKLPDGKGAVVKMPEPLSLS
jgi:hypothetical protein